jgi:hypothetical protein
MTIKEKITDKILTLSTAFASLTKTLTFYTVHDVTSSMNMFGVSFNESSLQTREDNSMSTKQYSRLRQIVVKVETIK